MDPDFAYRFSHPVSLAVAAMLFGMSATIPVTELICRLYKWWKVRNG